MLAEDELLQHPVANLPVQARADDVLQVDARDVQRVEVVQRDVLAADFQLAVGAPVRAQLGAVVAAMSVVMPTGRFGPADQELCTEAVKKATAAFSAYLGWIPRGDAQHPHRQQ